MKNEEKKYLEVRKHDEDSNSFLSLERQGFFLSMYFQFFPFHYA